MDDKSRNPIELHFNVISRYHYILFAVLFLSKMPIFWHVVSLLFLAPPMNYVCSAHPGDTPTRNLCPCPNPKWDKSVFTQTLQTKYNINCDRKWLITLSHSMMYFGSLMGSFIFGFLSDKFGRLSMFCVCLLAMAIFGTTIIYMPSIAFYICNRVLEGVGVGGAIVTGYVLCVEFCGVRNREVISALFHVPLNIGHMSLSGISYLLRDCDDLQLAISIPLYLFVAMKICFLESPKWLMDSGQFDKALLVMSKICKINKTPFDPIKAEMEAHRANASKTDTTKMQFWHIFRFRKLTINFICMSFIYFVCGMGYYGVSQYIGQMSGNIHENVALSGGMLIPGSLLATVLLYTLSRKTFLMVTSFLSGGLMLIVVLTPADLGVIRVIIASLCNTCFFMSFIVVFLYGVELFPTNVRNSVLGVLTVMARVGQMSAPVVNSLPQKVSGVTFSVLAILGGVLCIPLPETKNINLPSSLEDSAKIPQKKQENTGAGVNITT